MTDHVTDEQEPFADTNPTQADLYKDLQRIGELEDQKSTIQSEINTLTKRLVDAIPNLEKDSLLHKMLSSTMKPKAPAKRTAKPAKKVTRKK